MGPFQLFYSPLMLYALPPAHPLPGQSTSGCFTECNHWNRGGHWRSHLTQRGGSSAVNACSKPRSSLKHCSMAEAQHPHNQPPLTSSNLSTEQLGAQTSCTSGLAKRHAMYLGKFGYSQRVAKTALTSILPQHWFNYERGACHSLRNLPPQLLYVAFDHTILLSPTCSSCILQQSARAKLAAPGSCLDGEQGRQHCRFSTVHGSRAAPVG